MVGWAGWGGWSGGRGGAGGKPEAGHTVQLDRLE